MHGVDFGQVSSQRAPVAHLYPADGLHAGGGLHERCVACCFPRILVDREGEGSVRGDREGLSQGERERGEERDEGVGQ